MARQLKLVPHPVDVMVGKLVRVRRLQLSMSQTKLANELGLTFQQIQKYERGNNRVSCSTLSKISEALDIPITYFFSETGRTEATAEEHPEPAHFKEGLRLISAFGQIEKSRRKKLLALVESLAPVKRSKRRRGMQLA